MQKIHRRMVSSCLTTLFVLFCFQKPKKELVDKHCKSVTGLPETTIEDRNRHFPEKKEEWLIAIPSEECEAVTTFPPPSSLVEHTNIRRASIHPASIVSCSLALSFLPHSHHPPLLGNIRAVNAIYFSLILLQSDTVHVE